MIWGGLHTILIDSCPDGLPQCLLPWLLPHDQLQAWRTLSKARGDFLIFDRCGGCMEFFPQRRKSDFLKWENCALWAEFLGSAFCGKGEGQHSQDLGPVGTVTCQELQTLLCCPRWKQEKAEARTACWSLENSPLGRPRKKNVTEKVERLRDNQRSLSVAIYNRDYKVVN